jgi:hypothetical protein
MIFDFERERESTTNHKHIEQEGWWPIIGFLFEEKR